ncbi:restriction endonuclease subunit S [Methylotuvimicrobium sp.]|uniref:restriction endonuclease subunit S n=1 Tax=Methylotuvimicrobium sp. TaxID=2822413 RepID=UPI003D65D624
MSWKHVKIGDVCKMGAGGTPLKSKNEFYEGGTIPWLLSGEVSQGEIFASKQFITDEGLQNSSAKIFPKNTVLVAMYGATAGQVGILRFEASTNQAVCGIYPNDNFLPEFIYYSMLYKQKELIGKATGNAQPNISQIKVKSTDIPFIDKDEQKRIVAILDEAFAGIDTAIANTEKNLANARELFESYLNSVFTQRGEGWEKKNLGDICENLDSKRIPITKSKRESGSIPYYGASGVVDYVADYLFNENLLLVSEDGANLLARTYPIAFSISGKTWVNNHAHVLRFETMSSQKFVEYYLNSISLSHYISGMAQPKLNQKSLNSIKIPFPDEDIKHNVVEKLDELSVETKRLQDSYKIKLSSLKELKQSLLQKAFSGELTSKPDKLIDEAVA